MKKFKVKVDGKLYEVGVDQTSDDSFNIELNNKKYSVSTEEVLSEEDKQKRKSKKAGAAGNENSINSPIPGTVGKIIAKEGSNVKNGEVVITLISMKMENEIKSTKDAKIKSIKVKEGENVDVGQLLIEFE